MKLSPKQRVATRHNHIVGFWGDALMEDFGLARRSSVTGKLMNQDSEWMIDQWFEYCPECGAKLEIPQEKKLHPSPGRSRTRP